MAKKRQLNVRLSDALLSQLEDRVEKTKMGMAAMVEVLLVQALQHQESSDSQSTQSDRLDSLEERIEALEAKFIMEMVDSVDSQQIEISPSVEILFVSSLSEIELDGDESNSNRIISLSDDGLASNINSEVRPAKQKKDKTSSKAPNSKDSNSKVPNSKDQNSKVLN
ncbi:MAG: hypothetical protein ACOYN8_11880 [Pseudanabaena sp.]